MSLKNFLKENSIDLILIASDGVFYYDLEIEKKSLKIKRTNKIISEIFKDEKIIKENLENALKRLKDQEKINEVGIILHLPIIFFQQVVLPRSDNQESAIRNYFQVNLPLPLEKYNLIYKEDLFHLSGNLSNFDVFLFSKEVIDDFFEVINKFEITVYFISPSFESIVNNLIYQAVINFNENYLIFFVDQQIIQVLFLENLKLEKYFIEKINPELTKFDILIKRFINYFETQNKKFNILVFTEANIKIEDLKIIKTNVYDFIAQGSLVLLKKIFNNQQFLDLMHFKPHFIYFLSRFKRVVVIGFAFILSLILIYSSLFLGFYLRFSKELALLKKELNNFKNTNLRNFENDFNYVLNFNKNLNKVLNEKPIIIDRLSEEFKNKLVYYDLEKREGQFILTKNDLEKFKKEFLSENYIKFKEIKIDKKNFKITISW